MQVACHATTHQVDELALYENGFMLGNMNEKTKRLRKCFGVDPNAIGLGWWGGAAGWCR